MGVPELPYSAVDSGVALMRQPRAKKAKPAGDQVGTDTDITIDAAEDPNDSEASDYYEDGDLDKWEMAPGADSGRSNPRVTIAMEARAEIPLSERKKQFPSIHEVIEIEDDPKEDQTNGPKQAALDITMEILENLDAQGVSHDPHRIV